MTKKNRGRWTTKDDEKLVKHWEAGRSTKAIAHLLGRSQAAVGTRLSTLRKQGIAVHRRGESPGAPAGQDRKQTKPTVQPTGEDAEPQVRKGQPMTVPPLDTPTMEEVTSLRKTVERLKTQKAEARAKHVVAQRRITTLENSLAWFEKRIDQGAAATEFMQQLKRENAALRKAIVSLNEVILVYTARGEDNA